MMTPEWWLASHRAATTARCRVLAGDAPAHREADILSDLAWLADEAALIIAGLAGAQS